MEAKNDLNHSCDRCGTPGARNFGDKWICDKCYYEYESCCMEFGNDDLWKEAGVDTFKNVKKQKQKKLEVRSLKLVGVFFSNFTLLTSNFLRQEIIQHEHTTNIRFTTLPPKKDIAA